MNKKILIYGYGNPGRQDDGLGVALVEEVEKWAATEKIPGLAFDSNYQLNAEDALALAEHDVVVFADATGQEPDAFAFRRLEPHATIAFSTHAMAPESVLALCGELYGKQPEVWLLTIRGYAWEPAAAPTPAAQANLAAALAFLKPWLRKQTAG
jgi:hydrogenase maturation protease